MGIGEILWDSIKRKSTNMNFQFWTSMTQIQGHPHLEKKLYWSSKHIEPQTLILGDFNILHLQLERLWKQKLWTKSIYLTDIYRTFHTKLKEYTFFSVPLAWYLLQNWPVTHTKKSLYRYKKTEIMHCIRLSWIKDGLLQ